MGELYLYQITTQFHTFLILPSVMLQNELVASQDQIVHSLHKPCFKIDITSLYIKTLAIKEISRQQTLNLLTFIKKVVTLIFCNTVKRIKVKM